jgi:hypothetical protein
MLAQADAGAAAVLVDGRELTTLGLLSPRTVGFSKSHALAGPIPFDELNAGQLKCPSDHGKGRIARLRTFTLKYPNGSHANAGRIRELLLRPVQQASGGSALGCRDQRPRRSHKA